MKVGDKVRFKKPKKHKIYGVITQIDENIDDVTWTQNGMVPNYIHVEIAQSNKRGEIKKQLLKTHEGKIMYIGRT
jgi:hypothetical protein